MKELSPQYLSAFCMELALLVRAGVPLSEGILVMRDEGGDAASEKLFDSLYDTLKNQVLFSSAVEATGAFPDYFLSMIRLGEASGKLEQALSSLATYYERRALLSENLKRAVLYPSLLFVLMSVIVAVIITQVLPIFNASFNQAGLQMSGLAVTLMNFGRGLSSASTAIIATIAILIGIGVIVYKVPSLKTTIKGFFERRWGARGIFKRISSSKFAMAMSMALSSGLNTEQAIALSGKVCGSSLYISHKVSDCLGFLEAGDNLEKSLLKSDIFSQSECRLLALGAKTGEIDTVMSEIARRGEEKVLDELDNLLRKIEPTLVIVMSLVVGLILFSVMLPLMGIMSSIG